MHKRISEIMTLLSKHRFELQNEKVLQAAISEVLTKANIEHEREFRLSQADVIDFFAEDCIGIEVKLKGNASEIYKQCKRYCEHNDVKALILVTNRSMGLPGYINSKPSYLVSLGKGWL